MAQSSFTNLNLSEKELVSQESIHKKSHKDGYFVTKSTICVLVVLVMVICIAIVLAVYFGHPDYRKAHEITTTTVMTTASRQVTSQIQTTPTISTDQDIPSSTMSLDVRLPDSIVPMHYTLRLRPDIYSSDPSDFKHTGTVQMVFRVVHETDKIMLHWKQLTIDSDNIAVYETGTNTEVPVENDKIKLIPYPYEFIQIPTQDMLLVNRSYTVHVQYSGKIKRDLTGLYYSSYVNDQGNRVYLLTSQLQVTDARKAFPCMDEPALKATFNVIIERQNSKQSKSNTQIKISENLSDGWIADHYETTPPMSTYLLAFLVSDFVCVHDYTDSGKLGNGFHNVGAAIRKARSPYDEQLLGTARSNLFADLRHLEVEVCSRENAINQTEFAMSVAVEIQEFYEWYHEIDYPLNKTSHVALPDFGAGGMENWGLINYREAAVLYDPSVSSDISFPSVFLSHELAHMWFGDLVTPAWWDDLWLNEGFAVFMGIVGMSNIKALKEYNMEDKYVLENMHPVMTYDSLVTSHPIYVPVNHPSEIGAIFDSITYYKGAAVVRMMKYFLGEETFRWGVSNYLKDRAYKAAKHGDLFDAMSAQAKQDGSNVNVSAVMNTWIMQMGYPVVTLDYTVGDDQIKLKQQHYLLDPTQNVSQQSPYGYTWMVPVSFMTDQTGMIDLGNISLTWLHTTDGSISNVPSNLKWIIGNVGQTFFYRVNYNEENWKALSMQLTEDHKVIPTINRAQIIDDAFNLGRSGHIRQLIALGVIQYMDQETEYYPWYALARNIGYMRKLLRRSQAYSLLRTYMAQKVGNFYLRNWGDETQKRNTSEQERGLSLLACGYGLKECTEKANNTFHEWMDSTMRNQSYSINPTFSTAVYCHGIMNGGINEWDFVYQMFLKSNSGAEKNQLLTGLGCSTQPWILQRYLQWALATGEHGFEMQDMLFIIPTVAGNSYGTHLTWNFLKANWDTFYERFGQGAFTLATLIDRITDPFSSEWELNDIQKFVADTPNLGTAKRAFTQAIEATALNIKWRKENEEQLSDWLMQT